ncbi:MAG: amidohydrolase family protein [Acidimicrobiia bacterium]
MSRAITVTGAVAVDGTPVCVRAVDGVITEVGADVAAHPGDEHVDARGDVLLRGLVNGHTHAAMTLFRGYGGDRPLMEWLEGWIWPAEARLTDEDVYWGTRLACLEMIRCGTTRLWDMYWHPVAVARAVHDAGLRATVGPPLIDGLDEARSKGVCDEAGALLDELAGVSPRVLPGLAPHGIYTASGATLGWVAEESARRNLPVQLHFLETADEVSGCLDRTGQRPTAYLESLGLLSDRLVLAHGVWLDDDDGARVAAHGSTVVTNPVSNLKLAVGKIFPWALARKHGIAVALGTDGAASNNSLDLLADLKVLALLQSFAADDPAAMPARDVWSIASGARAPVLHRGAGMPVAEADDVSGATGDPTAVEVRHAADFFLVRRDAPELAPGHVLDNLVYAADHSVVRTTIVDGRVLMRDGVIEDEAEVVARVGECARRLGVV